MELITTLHNISTKIAIAVITILIGLTIAKLAGKIIKRVLTEAEINRILVAAGFKPLSEALARIAEYAIYLATLTIVLQQFGLTKIVITTIAIISGAVILIALFLAFRDFVPNAIAGMIIHRQMKKLIGKKVQIGDIKGTLEKIGIVASTIRNKDEHYIPHLYTSRKEIKQLRAD